MHFQLTNLVGGFFQKRLERGRGVILYSSRPALISIGLKFCAAECRSAALVVVGGTQVLAFKWKLEVSFVSGPCERIGNVVDIAGTGTFNHSIRCVRYVVI